MAADAAPTLDRRRFLKLGGAAALSATLPDATRVSAAARDPVQRLAAAPAKLPLVGDDYPPTAVLPMTARYQGLDGCHISIIGYVVIGHVPVDAVRKLLAERPKIVGISIPGMPTGLPGMPEQRPEAIRDIRNRRGERRAQGLYDGAYRRLFHIPKRSST